MPKCVDFLEKIQTRPEKCQKVSKMAKSTKTCSIGGLFVASFLEPIQTLFVTVTQCNKQKICLSQRLSATNQTILVAVTQCNKQY